MHKPIKIFWGVAFFIAFHCLRILYTVTKIRVHGALVIVWHEGKVLLIKKSYRKGWSIPGGMLNRGEAHEAAAVRETFEEVGLQLGEKDLSFVAEVPGDVGPRDRARIFEADVAGPIQIKVDGREIIEAEFVTPEEALKRVSNPRLIQYLRAQVA